MHGCSLFLFSSFIISYLGFFILFLYILTSAKGWYTPVNKDKPFIL